ncbi:T9SS type A sorting domain-containing protein [Aequorivita sediminis]|uniref:T9SS type A sorting domain-containing protein n=1 Tax=Aequorivita sediminis TaxID=3073653 RepID=UPI0028AB670C|nr:T9SS type A sorting domain-containing protein [Aequorivita sp. F6058]
MKKTTLFIILCFSFLYAFSQGDGEPLPVSWGLNMESTPNVVELPAIDLETIIREDQINDRDKSMPWRYGIEIPVRLDMQHDGLWTVLPNGGKIWQTTIQSSEAVNLSVNFDQFYLPTGSRLQLFNGEHTDITSTFTSNQNRDDGRIGTWFVEGDVLWIEYYQPPNVKGEPELQLRSVIHGYRMTAVDNMINNSRGINESGDCNYDVNCSVGNDFDQKKDLLKKSVALLNLGNGLLCSSALINNTRNDKTPYLLTANHCLDNSDPSFWTVRFNWVSPNPVCGTGEDSSDIQTNFTISGAELKANNSLSDFALVKLYDDIPNSWDVAFAGWDNLDADPLFGVGIHHPQGDIMKVCRDDSGAQKIDANGTKAWIIGGGSQGYGNGWEIGTTESGSSGSPLFNENGKIIGQLYAGEAACLGLETNNGYDLYGRFGVSWNTGTSAENRLVDWLDPIESGQTSIETLQNNLNVPDFEDLGKLLIYPNPANTTLTVLNNRYPNLRYQLFNVMGQEINSGSLSNTMNTIIVDNISEGIYFLYLVNQDNNDSITKKIIIKH